MTATNSVSAKIDLEKFRLRTFVDQLIDMGEVEIHDEPVPLTGLGEMIERTEKAVLFKSAGPERAEIVAKTAASRTRLIAAFETTEEKIYDEYFKRLANPKPVVEIPSGDAPVHAVQITGKDVDLTKLPFYPHHAYDGSCYMSSATDYTIDPATGRRNVGCRRLSLRNRYETGTNVTAPSDLKRIYTAAVARGERLPITFTVGTHPLDFVAATMRHPGDELSLVATLRGEPAAVVKSLTNDILVPADAEMTLEGYLDERGYVEPEGPFGEYMGYYGAIHMDPVFHCTAITMRTRRAASHACSTARRSCSTRPTARTSARSAPKPRRCESSRPRGAIRSRSIRGTRRAARTPCASRSGSAASAKRGSPSRRCSAASRGSSTFSSSTRTSTSGTTCRCEWALGTRFQADQDLVILQGIPGMSMDPSLQGRRTGAKSGFDCTKPFGRNGEIPLTRSAAKSFKGPARFQNIEQALATAPMFYADLVESIGSRDGREIACGLDELRQNGRLGRDRDGRYHLAPSKPGVTAIVGELYHDPNSGL